MKLADNKATLSFSNGSPSVELPVYSGSVGPDVIDIRKLYGQTGMFTYDPGFLSTAACQSAITYIDGDKGELLYRGYPIEQLATDCDFMETCHLLLYGNLPDAAGKAVFVKRVTQHTMVNEQMQFFLRGFRRDAHPMAIMTGLVGALSAFYHDSTDINNPGHRDISAIRLIAKLPTLVAMAYKYSIGQPFMYPKNDLSYAGNFLHMMFATPCEPYVVNPVIERALDQAAAAQAWGVALALLEDQRRLMEKEGGSSERANGRLLVLSQRVDDAYSEWQLRRQDSPQGARTAQLQQQLRSPRAPGGHATSQP